MCFPIVQYILIYQQFNQKQSVVRYLCTFIWSMKCWNFMITNPITATIPTTSYPFAVGFCWKKCPAFQHAPQYALWHSRWAIYCACDLQMSIYSIWGNTEKIWNWSWTAHVSCGVFCFALWSVTNRRNAEKIGSGLSRTMDFKMKWTQIDKPRQVQLKESVEWSCISGASKKALYC